MSRLRRARLLWHTVRYLRARQITGRARLKAQAEWRRRFPDFALRRYEDSVLRHPLRPAERRWAHARDHAAARSAPPDLAAAASRAADAAAGRFRFLNVTSEGGRPVSWDAPTQSQLWRYQLQYGGYLVDLAIAHPDAWTAVSSLVREWIRANPLGHARDAWHPFVVSERAVNWMLAIHLCAPRADQIGDDILRSLAVQCAFIEANLETDVGGNHLLKNLKAMLIAGCFWEGRRGARWYEHHTRAFANELHAQLLADGAHYERSPMYHALVLQDALEAVCAVRAAGRAVPEALASATRTMVDYLPRMVHPDGEIALFNDSVFGEAPSPASLRAFAARALDDQLRPDGTLTVRQAAISADLDGPPAAAANRVPGTAADDGGLVTVTAVGRRGFALIDVGPACPDDLPAHAHADLFSFELSLDGHRMIVDSGVGEYQPGPWREYYRSTRAHNTVAVDGEDQIECWGSFRVARRARVLDRAAIDGPLLRGVAARHDGYARLRRSVAVRRAFVALDDRAWLVVDSLDGAGEHRWQSFLHAAPDVAVARSGPGHAHLSTPDRRITIAWFGMHEAAIVKGKLNPRQGWYAPEFGRHEPSGTLVLSGRGALPVRCGYLVVPDAQTADVSISESAGELAIGLGQDRFAVSTQTGVPVARRVS